MQRSAKEAPHVFVPSPPGSFPKQPSVQAKLALDLVLPWLLESEAQTEDVLVVNFGLWHHDQTTYWYAPALAVGADACVRHTAECPQATWNS